MSGLEDDHKLDAAIAAIEEAAAALDRAQARVARMAEANRTLAAALAPFAAVAQGIDQNVAREHATWKKDKEFDPIGPGTPPDDLKAEVRFWAWGGDDAGATEIDELRDVELTLGDFRRAVQALAKAAGVEQ